MRLLLPLILLTACLGNETVTPDPTSWATGEWVAVRVAGQPLPYRTALTQRDSLKIRVISYQSAHAATVLAYLQALPATSGSPPVPMLCGESNAITVVTTTTLQTGAKGSTTNVGNCGFAHVLFSLTRKGDSLAGKWFDEEVRLVKR